jgi:hypothetical protein
MVKTAVAPLKPKSRSYRIVEGCKRKNGLQAAQRLGALMRKRASFTLP